MKNVNASQVQRTNNVSTISKCSAASKNYFQDDFIEEFAGKPKGRTSLIHLGYYTRVEIMNKLINDYIKFLDHQKVLKFQIVSCGCGFDTTYWRLSQLNLLHRESLLIEIDFPNVIREKLLLINQSQKLKNYLSKIIESQLSSAIHKLNNNYYILEADLSDIILVEKLFKETKINFDIPTLFLSECAVTYMKDQDSDNLIKWMAKKFKNCCIINYEQIHPFDSFGQIMVTHFEKLQSPLFSVFKYPDCQSHFFRYTHLGFENSFAISEWDALMWLTSEEKRNSAFSLEVFDEFEEFHLKCNHYVVAFAGNGISSVWINSFPTFSLNTVEKINLRPKLSCDIMKNSFQLCKHCSCDVEDHTFLFGGFNGQHRLSLIFKYTHKNSKLQQIKQSGCTNLKLDMVYGTVTYFQINKKHLVCLYGGRTSPDKIWNNGLPAIFELAEGDEFSLRTIIIEGEPVPRYRTSMVLLNSKETTAELWMFGGRSPHLKHPLSDFWKLVINHHDEKTYSCIWTQIKKTYDLWPNGRMSHSLCACPKRNALFLTGGFETDSTNALNDMWKWCCKSASWYKVESAGKLLPRYSHTSHIKDDVIYLVGGVNTSAGVQPGVATICLTNLTVTEYELPILSPPLLLFNHTSVVYDDGVLEIMGGGGQCFSFGTYINEHTLRIRIDHLK